MSLINDSQETLNMNQVVLEKTTIENDLDNSIIYQESNHHPVCISKSENVGSGKIVSLIGCGGMARVYKIWNEKLEVYRAVKIINCTKINLINRLQTECKITAKLHHPFIVQIFDFGNWNNLPFIEMEYIDGSNLQDLINAKGNFPEIVCSSIAIQISRALYYAHNEDITLYNKTYHGIIHRDLKPANIMVNSRGEIRLLDFGIARPVETNLHTTDGSFIGTLPYLSPEQIDGIDLDIRTDIYSIGTILYEMLTGAKAFTTDSAATLIKDKFSNNFKKLSGFQFTISKEISKIVYRCLQIDRNNRYPDTITLLSDLLTFNKLMSQSSPAKILRDYFITKTGIYTIQKKHRIQQATKPRFVASIVLILIIILVSLVYYNLFKTTDRTFIEKDNFDTTNIGLSQSTHYGNPDSMSIHQSFNKSETQSFQPETVRTTKNKSVHNFKLGRTLFQEKKFDKAIDVLKNISDYHPEKIKIKLMLFEAYLELDRISDAKNLANSINFTDAQFDLLCGRLNYLTGNLTQALECFKKALTRQSTIRNINEINDDGLYYIAETCSKIYRRKPSIANRSQMLDAWEKVKNIYTTKKGNPRFQKSIEILSD